MSSFPDAVFLPGVPAFMIGTVFGALVGLGLLGERGSASRARATLVRSAIGSAAGLLLFVATVSFWPPIVGPFMTCPATAIAAVLLFQSKK